MKTHIDKNLATMGMGSGVGLIQTYVTRDILDSMLGPIPYISDYIGPYGTYSVFGNIAIGASVFSLATFTSKIHSDKTRAFLQGYGLTTLLGGILNGIFPTAAVSARLKANRGGGFRAGNEYRAPPPQISRSSANVATYQNSNDMLLV